MPLFETGFLYCLLSIQFTDRIRNSMKILEDMDLNTELADPETTYRRQEPWSSQTSGLLSTGGCTRILYHSYKLQIIVA